MTPIASAAGCTRIVGPPGSGKTRELLKRIDDAELPRERLIVASPHPLAARALGGTTLGTFAFAILEANAFASGLALELSRIDDVDAETHFESAAAELFSLEWVDLVEPELGNAPSLDYEIAGLRAPERFAQAAYRLIRKLRGAGISPEEFLQNALRKATEWYANPPNLANPDLLFGTNERYRDSLNVDAKELERQRRREVDLAKILVRTFESYIADADERGCLTEIDAIAEATRVLKTVSASAERVRERYPLAFIDDAQDLSLGELGFLQAIYGESLAGVTFAGDPDQATRTFAGARPERVFACGNPLELPPPEGPRATIIAAAQQFLHDRTLLEEVEGRIRVARLPAQDDEATFIASHVAGLLQSGTKPENIAVLVRSLRGARPYVDALLAANVGVRLLGDLDLLGERTVQDALALLWAIHDPLRHDWLLRALQTPTLRLADATLIMLSNEPAQPQAALFTEVEGDDEPPARRFDPDRERRLSLNVTRGDRDAELELEICERLVRFRETRERWRAMFDVAPLEDAVRVVLTEGGLFEAERGETGAQSAHRRDLLERFLVRLARFARADRTRNLGDALLYLERVAASEWPQCDAGDEGPGVVVAAIEAVKGRTYEYVFTPNLRAGAFPPYWVPDAFVYTIRWGIIPKDNVGDARAARTAKFTWYQHNSRIREQHSSEDRRLLYCAMTRATERVTLTAWGTPTRGNAAPELLAELESTLGKRG